MTDNSVAAFMIFNGKTNSFNVESLEGQSHAKAMRESCFKIQEEIGNKKLTWLNETKEASEFKVGIYILKDKHYAK